MIEEFMEIYLVTARTASMKSLPGVSDFHVTPIFDQAIINYMLGTFSSPPHNRRNLGYKTPFSLQGAHEFVVLVLEAFQYRLRPKLRRVIPAMVEVS